MSRVRSFEHSLAALADIFAFVEEAFAAERVDDALRHGVDFVIEELFTNIVKYGHGRSPVRIEIGAVDRGVEVTVTEFDADRFDVTRPPAVDVTLPAASRRPGGLGLHLIRRFVESIDYAYAADERRGRIRFRVAPADAAPSDPAAGSRPC
jgi:serine/threonine-protein kinase RsbW